MAPAGQEKPPWGVALYGLPGAANECVPVPERRGAPGCKCPHPPPRPPLPFPARIRQGRAHPPGAKGRAATRPPCRQALNLLLGQGLPSPHPPPLVSARALLPCRALGRLTSGLGAGSARNRQMRTTTRLEGAAALKAAPRAGLPPSGIVGAGFIPRQGRLKRYPENSGTPRSKSTTA